MLNKIKKDIPQNASLLLAISGGVDSVVLLDCIAKLKNELNLKLVIAHVNHSLRDTANRDEDFVKGLAANYNCQIHIKHCQNPPKTNVEAWGREQRYTFFEQVVEQEKIDWVLTAHNSNDQAETLLMKLLSNRELQSISFRDPKRKLLRPLLRCTREEIEKYAEDNSLENIVDESNSSLDYLRNKVRLKILPFLEEQLEQGITLPLSEKADTLNEDIDFILSNVERCAGVLVNQQEFTKEWKQVLQKILSLESKSITWRLIEYILLPKLGFKIGKRAALRVEKVIMNESLAAELPGGYRIYAKDGGIDLEKL